MQNQLQMISPISSNHLHEKIIKSFEAKPNIIKPSVLIPSPTEVNNLKNITPNKLSNTFFTGKRKRTIIGSMENTELKQTKDESISTFLFNHNTSIVTEPKKSIFEKNFTNFSFVQSTLDSSKFNQILKNLPSHHYTEKTAATFMPLTYINDKYKRSIVSNLNKLKKVKNNDVLEKQKKHYFLSKIKSLRSIKPGNESNKYSLNSLLLDLKNRETYFNGFINYMYNTTLNNSLSSEKIEILTKRLNIFNKNYDRRSKRSYELFFNSDLQVSHLNIYIL